MLTALLVIAILVFLIVVHEIGHFVAAKIFRIRVLEFGIGYPPRAFLMGVVRGTEYTLNWIPFGGFVRIFGEDEGSEHGRGSFADSPRWKQAIVLVAGVTMNALAAWGLFTGAYMTGILHPIAAPTENARLIVTDVVQGSPADSAGVRAGDEIIELEEIEGTALASLTPETVLEFVQERPGKDLIIAYERGGSLATTTLQPAHGVVSEEANRPAVGIGLVLVTSESLSFSEALSAGWAQTIGTFKLVFSGLKTLITDAFSGSPNLEDIVGPVGLIGVVGEAAHSGWGYVLSLAGFISVNLAIINLIPIPALDGGRLTIVGVEALTRRPAPKLAVQFLNTLGLALIILLMLTVTYNDIARLIM